MVVATPERTVLAPKYNFNICALTGVRNYVYRGSPNDPLDRNYDLINFILK